MKKLIIGIIFHSKVICEKSIEFLEKKYGPVLKRSDVYDFNFTTYYETQMGRELKRVFLLFDKEITTEDLIPIKHYADELEKKCGCDYRSVNIDPGYISEEEFAMSSFKKKPWVTHIGEDVYLHTIFKIKNGEVIVDKHTYPEFRIKEKQDFLLSFSKL